MQDSTGKFCCECDCHTLEGGMRRGCYQCFMRHGVTLRVYKNRLEPVGKGLGSASYLRRGETASGG